jgi:integrase
MIEGVHFVRAVRKGRAVRYYVYAWRGGPQIMAVESPTRPKLTKDALEKLGVAHSRASSPPPNTLLSLIREWRPNSPEWKDLSDGTRRVWGYQLDAIEAKWGKTPLSVWSDPRMVKKVVEWRDSRADTPRPADMGVQVLFNLLTFGRLRGQVTVNVAADIPRLYKGGDRADIIWTQDEIDRFCVAAIQLDRPQMIDAIYLAALTGLRRQDLVTLTWDHVGEFAVVKKALKRSARKRRFARMPLVPELDAFLIELQGRYRKPGVDTVLVNSFGEPWAASGDGFGGSFNRVRDYAGITHWDDETETAKRKHLHDVRGSFVTKLCVQTDLTDKEIADVMAWSPERIGTIRRVYVDDASIVVALGERIAAGAVKRPVKRSGSHGE